MARCNLYGPDIANNGVPPICIACGNPAAVFPKKKFSWNPGWVYLLLLAGILPFVIIALVMTWERRVCTPFCDRHAGYWRLRTWVILGGLLTIIATAVLLGFAGMHEAKYGGEWVGWAWIAFAVAAIVWLFAAVILQGTSIRPAEISRRRIVLVGVHPAFAQAVHDQQNEREVRDADPATRSGNRPRPQRSEFDDD
jgi:hypothetical protein